MTIVSVPRSRTLNERLLEGRERRRRRPEGATTAAASAAPPVHERGKVIRALLRLRREVGFLLTVPDEGRGWTLKAARRTRRLIREIRPDIVVSSGPPHCAHAAALLATWAAPSRWVMDLRDPWAWPIARAWQDYPRYRSLVFMTVNRVLEWAALLSAGLVICNTRELTDALQQRHPAKRFEWIPNSVDPETLPRPAGTPFPGMSLAYVGTVYGGRDLTPVLRGLRRFLDLHPEAVAAGTKLRIAGQIHDRWFRELRVRTTEVGLADQVEVLGLLPRDEALRVAARSRVTVVLAQDQDWQVPAKLYEMVALGNETVVVANDPSAAASEARRLGASVVTPDDPDSLLNALLRAWQQGAEPTESRRPAGGYQTLAPRVAELLLEA